MKVITPSLAFFSYHLPSTDPLLRMPVAQDILSQYILSQYILSQYIELIESTQFIGSKKNVRERTSSKMAKGI